MRLVQHWRLWWRRASTWLAALYASATAVVVAAPAPFVALISYIPNEYRNLAAGGLFAVLFAVPVITAHIRQPKLVAKRQELENGPS